MKHKLAFWLILTGLIIGLAYSIWIAYGLIQSQKILSDVSYANSQTFSNFELYTKIGMISSYISLILGLILSGFIAINLIKLYKKPNKRNFKFIVILSALGLVTSIFYGAVLTLMGGIIGYNSKNLH